MIKMFLRDVFFLAMLWFTASCVIIEKRPNEDILVMLLLLGGVIYFKEK